MVAKFLLLWSYLVIKDFSREVFFIKELLRIYGSCELFLINELLRILGVRSSIKDFRSKE